MRPTILLIICLAASWAAGAPKLKDPPAKEPPSVLGEWVNESLPNTRYVFGTDGMFLFFTGPGGPTKYTYTVNPKTVPAELNVTQLGTSSLIQGIYKIEGDTLTACFPMPGAERPTRFEKSDKPHVGLSVYKRVKKD